MTRKTISYTETKESTHGNRVQPRRMAKAVHGYEHGTEYENQKWFGEGLLQTDKQSDTSTLCQMTEGEVIYCWSLTIIQQNVFFKKI